MDTGFETRIDFSALNEKIGLLREQMARVIIGQRQVSFDRSRFLPYSVYPRPDAE